MLIDLFNFNSIKVRLEREEQSNYRESTRLFQFHKGTIRTFLTLKIIVLCIEISIP